LFLVFTTLVYSHLEI